MAERPTIPQPAIEIGATPLYVKTPVIMKFDHASTPITKIDLHGMKFDPHNPQPGLDKAVILMKSADPATSYKPLQNIDDGGTVNWNDVYGIMITDDEGTKIIEQKDLSLTPPAPEPTPAPKPEVPPATPALDILAQRAKSISLIGLDVDQMIQAKGGKDMEKLAAETKGLIGKIWKGNVAHELLEEHAYQFRKKQVDAAHMMLSDEMFTTIESRADTAYMEAMNKKTKFGRAWTKFKDAVTRNVGGYTTKENLAIAQAGEMYAAGELANMQQYEDNVNAVRTRFEQDFMDADGVIRKNLGENLTIFKSGDPKHKEMVDGIKDLVHKYVNGDFANKQVLETALTEFARTHGIGKDPKTAQEAQLYTSSLYQFADQAKARMESGVALNEIDAQLDVMEVRIGRAQMGEATQVERSATRKTVDWLLEKNIVGTLVNNEATLGTAVAAALSLAILPRMTASRVARLAGGAIGGGAVAGAIAGLKENARMKREWFQFIRQRETGAGLPQPGDKLREWMAKREIPQVSVTELTSRITATAYENGQLKADLSGEDITKTLAYLADAKARRALSARGGENISLIRWGPAVDVERTNLDLSIDKLERDLLEKFGQTISDRTKLLTDAQTKVLAQGRDAASLSDPLKVALDAVSDHDPAVQKFRRKLLIYGKVKAKGEVQGLDAALAEIKTQIRLEATRRGVNTAVIGTGIGTALSEGGYLIAHHDEVLTNIQHVLHIGPQIQTEVPVDVHLAVVPTIPHFVDAQGVDHAIQASIPEHTNLIADPATHTFTLMDANNHALVHGITIDAHGQIANVDALNASPDAIDHGLHFGNTSFQVVTPGTEHVVHHIEHHIEQQVNQQPISGTGFDISAKEMGPNGDWGWMEHYLRTNSDVQHVWPATNLHKNLFQLYENMQHSSNVDIQQIEGYHRIVPVDAQGNLRWNMLPDNLWFRHVPDIFNHDGQVGMGHLMDKAVDAQNQFFAANHIADINSANYPGWEAVYKAIEASDPQNGHIMALAWKIGVADIRPSQAEFNEFMHWFTPPTFTEVPVEVSVEVPVTEVIVTGPTYQTLYQGIINQTETQVTTAVPAASPLFTTIPAVVPLPREGMKPGRQTIPTPYPEYPEYSQEYPMDIYKEIPEPPHYYDEMPSSQEFPQYEHMLYETLGLEYPQGDNLYEISFSDRLRPLYEKLGLEYDESKTYQDHLEFLYDKIKITKEIQTTTEFRLKTQQDYLDGLETKWTTENSDPRVIRALYRMNGDTQSYYQELESLNNTLPPMHKDCKFTVVIPAYNEQDKIDQALTTWIDQFKSNENTRIDPNSFEIIVFLNRPNPDATYDQTRQRIEAFKQKPENAPYHIHIIEKTFNIQNQDTRVNINGKQVLVPKGRRMGLIYGTATDLAVLRNMTREAPNEIKANHILKTGGADVVARNPNYIDQTYQVFDNNPFIEQYTSRSDYPSSIFEHVPLFHVTERFREIMNLQYTKRKSNLGPGVYRTALYAEAGGFNPDDAVAEEVRLNERMRKFLLQRAQKEGRTRDSVIRRDTLLRAIDDPRRALSAVWQGIPMNHAYDNFWNNKVVKDMRTNEILKRPVPPEAQLTKENLATQLGDYVQYYARMIYQYHPDSAIRNNMAETVKLTQQYADHAFHFLGFQPSDYEWAIGGNVTDLQQVPDINSASRQIRVTFNDLSHLNQLLEEYKLRKKPEWTTIYSPKKSTKPRKIPTQISPAPKPTPAPVPTPVAEQTPEELAAKIKLPETSPQSYEAVATLTDPRHPIEDANAHVQIQKDGKTIDRWMVVDGSGGSIDKGDSERSQKVQKVAQTMAAVAEDPTIPDVRGVLQKADTVGRKLPGYGTGVAVDFDPQTGKTDIAWAGDAVALRWKPGDPYPSKRYYDTSSGPGNIQLLTEQHNMAEKMRQTGQRETLDLEGPLSSRIYRAIGNELQPQLNTYATLSLPSLEDNECLMIVSDGARVGDMLTDKGPLQTDVNRIMSDLSRKKISPQEAATQITQAANKQAAAKSGNYDDITVVILHKEAPKTTS